jgi:hypothetical protein
MHTHGRLKVSHKALHRCLLPALLGWVSLLCLSAQAQTFALADLPYRDPRLLDAMLARDEAAFQRAIQRHWPRTERMLAMFVPLGAHITSSSLVFDTLRQRCTQQREPAACRLYMDFLSFQMKQKTTARRKAGASLPVLLRPAQLPFRDSAVLNAMTALDPTTLQSALAAHWDWMHDVIERFLPDHYALYPVSKVFEAIRATCREARTETACRLHLADIDSILDNNRRHLPTLFLTLKQIPYRDPAPLHALLQLGESGWRAEVNQTQLDDLLNRYIARSVAIVGDLDFARARLDCQVVMPGDYVRCRDYLGRLARLMRNR